MLSVTVKTEVTDFLPVIVNVYEYFVKPGIESLIAGIFSLIFASTKSSVNVITTEYPVSVSLLFTS